MSDNGKYDIVDPESNFDKDDDIEINYIFHFFNKAGDYLDCTSLDENNPTHALYLFKDEFGWGDVKGGYVELIEWDDPTIYDNPDMLELSSNVREDGRRLCSASNDDPDDIAELKTCPMYSDEEEADDSSGGNVTCGACWAIGFKSVCERKPKEI